MNRLIKSLLIKPFKNAYGKYCNDKLHSYHKKMAFSALYSIEKQNGKLNISLKRKVDEYAIEVLGSKSYAPWLYVYSAVRNEFIEGWIPGNYYVLILTPFLNGKYSQLDSLRTLTNRILASDSIPDTAYIIDGILYSNDFKIIGPDNARQTIFGSSDIVFFKRNESAQGRGVVKLERRTFEVTSSLYKHDGCFQSRIIPNDFFNQITSNSTSTIRITTVRDYIGEVSVRAAYLRVGRDSDTIVKSLNAIRIPINLTDGSLYKYGYMPNWSYSQSHPDTGFVYLDREIPYFNDAKDLCTSLHKSFPHFPIIGWDVCIDKDDRVKVMEWNANQTDIVFSEATTGPCFKGLGWEEVWKKNRIKS